MAMFRKRQLQAFDLDAFEDDGGDIDSPGLMQMFVKQNRRVLKIFESENSDNEDQIGNQSYGLRLISRSDGVDENDSSNTGSSSPVNKSKEGTQASGNSVKQNARTTQLHVRNLSPVDIVTLSSEDVSEKVASPKRASQLSPALTQMRSKTNQSLRRSLFNPQPFPPSSTPLSSNRKSTGNAFKSSFDSILSPIKPSQANDVSTPRAVQLHSLDQIEQDLQLQFGIKEVAPSQPPPDPCFVHLEKMQVDDVVISEYLSHQESVAARVPDSTNLNQCSMIETPIVQRNRRDEPECDVELARKLQLCETSDETTEQPASDSENLLIEVEENASNNVSSTVTRPTLKPQTKVNKKQRKEKRQPSTSRAKKSPEDRAVSETSQQCNDSISKTLDPAVMKSFRNLSKRPHAQQDQPLPMESFKFAQPKRRKSTVEAVSSSTAKYLDMTKQKKAKKNNVTRAKVVNKKRTLYSQEDEESVEGSSSQQIPVEENTSPPRVAEPQKNSKKAQQRSSSEEGSISDEENDMTKQKKTKKNNVTRAKVVNKKQTLYSQEDEESVEGSSSQQIPVEENTSPPRVAEPQKNGKKAQQRPSSEEGSISDEEKEDEGFDSGDLTRSFDDVRYDPYEFGCQRPGLRVRRFANPYWINNGSAKNYAITFGAMTKKQCKEAEKLVKAGRSGVNQPQKTSALKSGTISSMVTNALESLKASRKQKSERKTRIKKAPTNAEVSEDDRCAAKSVNSFSSVIQGLAASNKPTDSVVRDSYNMASINSVQFRDCGDGLYFGAFIDGKADGIIKLIPGGRKKLARSKYSSLKFFVLQGTVDVTCNDESLTLEQFGFLDINANYYYALSNSSDNDVFVQFTRFDRRQE